MFITEHDSYDARKRDVFNFAITLWEMLARQEPMIAKDDATTLFGILNQIVNGK